VLPRISQKVLSAHLKTLGADSVVSRPVLTALAEWDLRHRKATR
jgi:DNA-binding HxlR family transcriptional regulator